ncbi:hypothetical protein, partial [Gluconacetobacter tumulicola]
MSAGMQAEDITVIGTSPLPGSGIDRDRLPAATAILTAHDLQGTGTADMLHALDSRLAGVSLNAPAGNPY